MSLFTRFRTALALAGEVERLKAVVAEQQAVVVALQFEWTDTLDKLLAREERWRKRYKSEVNNALAAPQAPEPEHVAPSSRDIKAALRSRLGLIRQGGGGGA